MKYAMLCAALALSACKQCGGGDTRTATVKPARDVMKKLTLDDYETAVYGPGPQATFQPTSATEHDAITHLIPKLLDGAWAAKPGSPFAWQGEAAAAGFRIEVWTIDDETYWALLEAQGQARGAGAYIFRVAPRDNGPTILLEAPHNFYDMGTGRLAADVFFAPKSGVRPRALFTNTIHRYQLAPGNKKKMKNHPADVAHNPEHAFTYATEAFAIAAGGTRVIQLHGFGNKDDDDDGDVGATNAVVSAGDAGGSSPLSTAIAKGLTGELGNQIKRFLEDVKFLGATTNAQGRMLRKIPHCEFVHVEMSADLRKQFANSPELRAKLATILFDAAITGGGPRE